MGKKKTAVEVYLSAVVLIIQWNYLLYMIPSRTFWGFLFFFLILIAFFLDISTILGEKTDESMANLGELSEWEGVVADFTAD